MVHTELNNVSVMDLTSYELADECAKLYVHHLYDKSELRQICKNVVDTIVYVIETAHPKAVGAMFAEKRLQLSDHLLLNCKEGLVNKGIDGVSEAVSHTITTTTRFMLANELKLRIVKQ